MIIDTWGIRIYNNIFFIGSDRIFFILQLDTHYSVGSDKKKKQYRKHNVKLSKRLFIQSAPMV